MNFNLLKKYFNLSDLIYITAYEYVQDSEITAPTLQSGSEEDLLEKVKIIKRPSI